MSGTNENNNKFWKNFTPLLQTDFKYFVSMVKKEEKLTGHYFLVSQKYQ